MSVFYHITARGISDIKYGKIDIMMPEKISIAVIAYPGVLMSAVHGFGELFDLASRICADHDISKTFVVEILALDGLPDKSVYRAIILPPNIGSPFCGTPDPRLIDWLKARHARGAVLCSVCAGAFILAATGLLDDRPATTHWSLADDFSKRFPAVRLASDRIIVHQGDIVTAGGLMAWLDLGLDLVARFTAPLIMRLLGKILVVDTGNREQRYYRTFTPPFDHGDSAILTIQHHLSRRVDKALTVSALAEMAFLGERTFFRRFLKATGLSPKTYIQHLRVQKACDLLEETDLSLETIVHQVGYEDLSAFRKVFFDTVGLTPRDFRRRFALNRKGEGGW